MKLTRRKDVLLSRVVFLVFTVISGSIFNLNQAHAFSFDIERPPHSSPAQAEAILERNQEFMDAWANGDAEGVASLYTADAQFLPANTPTLFGRGEIQSFIEGGIEAGINSITLDTEEIKILGSYAWEVGRYALSVDDVVVDAGRYIVIWKRVRGEWYLHRDITNTD